MSEISAAISMVFMFAAGYLIARLEANGRIQAAESKLEHWHQAAKAQAAEVIVLVKEIAELTRLFRTPAVVVPAPATGGVSSAGDGQDEDDEQPMSVREADALEMQRRRAAERIRRTPRPEDEISSDREPVHVDDRRATPPIRTTDIRDE